MKKILLISGHGAGDCGATGNGYTENELTIRLVNSIANHLYNRANVTIYPHAQDAFEDTKAGKGLCTLTDYDLALEVHFNSYSDLSANGVEVVVPLGVKPDTYDLNIVKALGNYFAIRRGNGVNYMNVLTQCTAVGNDAKKPYIYLETCFISNANDMNIYLSNEDRIAKAIADVLCDNAPVVDTPQPSQPVQPTPSNDTIVQGSKVVVTTPVSYDGVPLAVNGVYDVIEVRGDRVVIGKGSAVTAAIHINNIQLQSSGGSVNTAGTITKGSKVVVTNPISYDGVSLGVSGVYDVIEVINDRVVIGKGSAVTSAIHINNIRLA